MDKSRQCETYDAAELDIYCNDVNSPVLEKCCQSCIGHMNIHQDINKGKEIIAIIMMAIKNQNGSVNKYMYVTIIGIDLYVLHEIHNQ